MLKNILSVKNVRKLSSKEQKSLQGGVGETSLSGGLGWIKVICTCSNGTVWVVGDADSSDPEAVAALGDQCREDGGTPSGH